LTGCQRVSNTRDHLLVAVAGANLAVGDHHNSLVALQASSGGSKVICANIPWPRDNDREASRSQRHDDQEQKTRSTPSAEVLHAVARQEDHERIADGDELMPGVLLSVRATMPTRVNVYWHRSQHTAMRMPSRTALKTTTSTKEVAQDGGGGT